MSYDLTKDQRQSQTVILNCQTVILNGVKNLKTLPEGMLTSGENFRFFAALRMT